MVGTKKPPNPGIDEVFEAAIQKKDGKNWITKWSSNQSGDITFGKSTFFPQSWNKARILEEIAFAWKNKRINDPFLPHILEGITTNNVKVEFIILNSKIVTVYPKI